MDAFDTIALCPATTERQALAIANAAPTLVITAS